MDPNVKSFVVPFIDEFLRKHCIEGMEIEAKIGLIVDGLSRSRVSYDVAHPIVFNRLPILTTFKSELKQPDYAYVKNKITDLYSQDQNGALGETKEVVPSEISETNVTICRNNIRMIEKDGKTTYQRKIRRGNIDIRIPGTQYDLRISASLEIDIDAEKGNKIEPGTFVRRKCRSTFDFKGVKYDFTRVGGGGEDNTYEVEVEIKQGTKMSGSDFFDRISVLLEK